MTVKIAQVEIRELNAFSDIPILKAFGNFWHETYWSELKRDQNFGQHVFKYYYEQ